MLPHAPLSVRATPLHAGVAGSKQRVVVAADVVVVVVVVCAGCIHALTRGRARAAVGTHRSANMRMWARVPGSWAHMWGCYKDIALATKSR